MLDEKLERGECFDCKHKVTMDNLLLFDFDHRDPSDKVGNVSKLVYGARHKFYQEVAKCDLVCGDCHAKRTHNHHEPPRHPGHST